MPKIKIIIEHKNGNKFIENNVTGIKGIYESNYAVSKQPVNTDIDEMKKVIKHITCAGEEIGMEVQFSNEISEGSAIFSSQYLKDCLIILLTPKN